MFISIPLLVGIVLIVGWMSHKIEKQELEKEELISELNDNDEPVWDEVLGEWV